MIRLLLGRGDGTFQDPISYTVPDKPAGQFVVADLNGDARPDIISMSYYTNVIDVLLNNGDGTYWVSGTDAVSTYTRAIAVADFDGDGRLDLAVNTEDQQAGNISIMLGNGDGTFQAPAIYGEGFFGGAGMAVADVNSDGFLDIVGTGKGVSVLLGKGDGTFYGASFYNAFDGTSVAIADFNGDGLLDVAEPNAHLISASVLLNQSSAPAASLSASSISFGKQSVGTTSSPMQVTLTNSGFSSLVIGAVLVSGDFLEKNTCGSSLAIQASCTITVQFRPRTTGLRKGVVTIQDNAPSNPQKIQLSGTGQ
jgi:hypothetical protein